MPATKIEEVLTDATDDLKDAEFTGIVGFVANPITENLLVPASETVAKVVPAVADTIPLPFVDEIGAFALSVPMAAAKMTYSLLPFHTTNTEDEHQTLFNEDLKTGTKKAHEGPNKIKSSLASAVGFGVNSVIDIASIPFNGTFSEWVDTLEKFIGYIVLSGVGKEMFGAFANYRVLYNLLIVARVQESGNKTMSPESRRLRAAMPSLPEGMDNTLFKSIMKDSARYCRYSTAAYGVSMIDSSELLSVHGKKVESKMVHAASEKIRNRKFARYVGVKEEDIIYSTNPGGNINLLGHLIAIDKRSTYVGSGKPAIVLAIRGTYSVSGLKSDAAAYSRYFCDGVAHAGIADRVDYLWDYVKDKIVQLLVENEGYDLVITGHSLGAGSAALLAIKLQYEDILIKANPKLLDVNVKCFAFAPPAVYYRKIKGPKMTAAMSNVYAFIHENDCVPFLSVDAVRRLCKVITDVDEEAKFQVGNPIAGILDPIGSIKNATKLITQPLMAASIIGIPGSIKQDVFEEHELPVIHGAEPLYIPSPYVMWMRKVKVDKRGNPVYNTVFCNPHEQEDGSKGVNDLNILLDKKMIADHMNPQYEVAVNSIMSQAVRKKEAYVTPE